MKTLRSVRLQGYFCPSGPIICVQIPDFVLRKLYRRGSLRETGEGRFAFTLQNTLRNATLVAPPKVVVNGILHPPASISAGRVRLQEISQDKPFVFAKGAHVTLHLKGHLMRGGNRIHITVVTIEYGRLEVYCEDKEAAFCDVPGDPVPDASGAVPESAA
ncbi:MAG: hypothetical protein QOD77_1570 [Thermoplasmata archaeon]|jgi:hypothetical protein|nr:hypothetical protein [Thermoplasmata archaeon]